MAKGQYLSSYQQGIVKRYYNHKETLTLSKLQEAVSDLYVAADGATGAKAADRKWKWIGQALSDLGVEASTVSKTVSARDLATLARLVGELAGPRR